MPHREGVLISEYEKHGHIYIVNRACNDHDSSTSFVFHSRYASVILVLITLVVASYNGATFYIDIFSHKYQSNRQKEK